MGSKALVEQKAETKQKPMGVLGEVHAAGPLDTPFWVASVQVDRRILAVNESSTKAEAEEWVRSELARRGLGPVVVLDCSNSTRTRPS